MAYTLLNHTAASGANGSTTPAINTTGADLIVIAVSSFSTNPEPVLSDSKGNIWTPLTLQVSGNPQIRLWYVRGGTFGLAHTFTLTGVASFSALAVQVFSGSLANPFDVESGNSQGASNGNFPGPLTPNFANSLLVTGISNTDLTFSADVLITLGYTITDVISSVNGVNFAVAIAYLIQVGAPSSSNPLWGWVNVVANAARIASFKPALSLGGFYNAEE